MNVEAIIEKAMARMPGIIRELIEEEAEDLAAAQDQKDDGKLGSFNSHGWISWANGPEYEFHVEKIGYLVIEGMTLTSPDSYAAAIRYTADTGMLHVYGDGVPLHILIDGKSVMLTEVEMLRAGGIGTPAVWHYAGALSRSDFIRILEAGKESHCRHVEAQIQRVEESARKAA